jgi:hypothetical protein
MDLVNGMNGTVYGSYKDGSDIYKDNKGYYIFQYNVKLNKEYKKYMPKGWKPKVEPVVRILKCTKKNKNGKWDGCKWTYPKGTPWNKTRKNKTRKNRK